MSDLSAKVDSNHRILIVDDNPSIHEDFEKILPTKKDSSSELDDLLLEILEEEGAGDSKDSVGLEYDIDHAFQGEQALEMVRQAETSGRPYALLFVDVRMPPGWDGIETIKRIWEEFPNNEVVICTAFTDYSWEEILEELGSTDQLQFLRKPFDVVSIKQMALAITRKWNLGKMSRQYTEDLETEVRERTQELREKIAELEKALSEIKQLQGILPMCAWCHKIRSDEDYWQQVDEYLSSHQLLEISHGICPECYENMMNKVEASEATSGGNAESTDDSAVIGDSGASDTSGQGIGDRAVSGSFSLRDLKKNDSGTDDSEPKA